MLSVAQLRGSEEHQVLRLRNKQEEIIMSTERNSIETMDYSPGVLHQKLKSLTSAINDSIGKEIPKGEEWCKF